jgi:hypothetical protein
MNQRAHGCLLSSIDSRQPTAQPEFPIKKRRGSQLSWSSGGYCGLEIQCHRASRPSRARNRGHLPGHRAICYVGPIEATAGPVVRLVFLAALALVLPTVLSYASLNRCASSALRSLSSWALRTAGRSRKHAQRGLSIRQIGLGISQASKNSRQSP